MPIADLLRRAAHPLAGDADQDALYFVADMPELDATPTPATYPAGM